MQIHQMLAALSFGDAIGDEALRIRQILRRRGFDSEIFAESVHPEMAGRARKLWDYRKVSSRENVVILHFSIGAGVSTFAYHLPDRILLIYHNITPARWFSPYHAHLAGLCYHGRRELAAFAKRTSLALGDSEFNRSELEAIGFHPTGKLPLLLDLDRLSVPASSTILGMFDDDKTNFLFVGRVIPNKRFEDVIKVFHIYRNFIDSNSRLLLVGEWQGFEQYFDALVRLVDDLALKDVVFTGHVDTDDLVAYYRAADVFLCMSEHEGFCVPLIEAFQFGVPVIAYEAGAVPETLGGAGVLVREKRYQEIAELAYLLVHDTELRQRIVAGQYRVLEKMSSRDDEATLMGFVDQVLGSASAEGPGRDSAIARASAFARVSASTTQATADDLTDGSSPEAGKREG
ncbi:MAG: glycosyltransferase [Acidobacteriota bacterium]